ncbi:RND family efflux pump outer membrane protein [Thermotomaculum hydrothermale]|uniref:RND family efflux pump outer membrane protein n=1 Tax=Thermotomaculum hydrothermale TaxID=981385 RepID=A0A7R6SZ47_9BACT|nr:TolC family protein [Thermotomaculum hydrothermale]BBB33370.1 RND family efflux pump outer membrane protein [Thermotomaculum hydrothermale]
MRKFLVLSLLIFFSTSIFAQGEKLTLEKAIRLALKNNLDIQISEISYKQAKNNVYSALGIYDLKFDLTAEHQDSTQPPRTLLDASRSVQDFLNFSLTQKVSTGATVTFTTTSYKYKTANYAFSFLNPVYGTTFKLRVDQPLLNGFGKKNVEYQIKVNRHMEEKAKEQFRQQVMNLIEETSSSYLDLVYAYKNLQVAKDSLKLAKEQYNITKQKIEVGTMAEVEIYQAEANLASAEQQLIEAQNLVQQTEDNLKKLLNIKENQWDIVFEPDYKLEFTPQKINPEEYIKTALKKNPQIKIKKIENQISKLDVLFKKNQKLPSVNFYASVAYAGNNAIHTYDNEGKPIVIPGSLGDAIDMALDFDNQTWIVGINISYKFQNRAAKAAYKNAILGEKSSELSLKNTIYTITVNVKNAIRNVKAAERAYFAAQKTRILREKDLEAEKKKFVNGMSTNFLVSQKEDELAKAKVNELNALVKYKKAILDLEKQAGILLDKLNFKID